MTSAKSWSSDGKSVVGEFSEITPSEKHPASGAVAIWDVATGAVTKLTDDTGSRDGHPDWSVGSRPWVLGTRRMVAVADPRGEHELQPSDTAPWSRVAGGVASIVYTLPKAGHVRVRVFDAAGHEVARPVDEWQVAGSHQTTFAFGAGPNQVFLYRVECGGRSTTGKISTGP